MTAPMGSSAGVLPRLRNGVPCGGLLSMSLNAIDVGSWQFTANCRLTSGRGVGAVGFRLLAGMSPKSMFAVDSVGVHAWGVMAPVTVRSVLEAASEKGATLINAVVESAAR